MTYFPLSFVGSKFETQQISNNSHSFSMTVHEVMDADMGAESPACPGITDREEESKPIEVRDDFKTRNAREESKSQGVSPLVSPASPLTRFQQRERRDPMSIFTDEAIMIRPDLFYENKDCQETNHFMQRAKEDAERTNERAQQEFDDLKKALTRAGIRCAEFQNTNPEAPDAIFPDWFTTHKNDDVPEGVFILYPMRHRSR